MVEHGAVGVQWYFDAFLHESGGNFAIARHDVSSARDSLEQSDTFVQVACIGYYFEADLVEREGEINSGSRTSWERLGPAQKNVIVLKSLVLQVDESCF